MLFRSDFDVVEKVYSFETGGWQNAQKGLYQIKDTFLNFWFKFVYPHLSEFYQMEPEEFYDRFIAGELESYLKRYFVNVCMEYLELQDMVNYFPTTNSRIFLFLNNSSHRKDCLLHELLSDEIL